jgi:hypothetical protein
VIQIKEADEVMSRPAVVASVMAGIVVGHRILLRLAALVHGLVEKGTMTGM